MEVSEDVDESAPSGATSGRPDWFRIVLVGAVAVGLVGRLTYTYLLRNHPMWSDSLGYHFRAQDLADGNGFVLPVRQVLGMQVENPPDAQMPPLWSLVLAVPTRFGMGSLLWQQVFAALVGAATIVTAGLAGRMVFGRRVGAIAAVLVAVYPNVWLYERELLSEPLAMLEISIMIMLSYRFMRGPSTRNAVLLGLMVGVLALTRAEQAALAPLLVVPLVLGARGHDLRRRVSWLAMAGAACVLVIVPWTAYNMNRFENPVLLSNGFGQALRAGNCERTYHGEFLGYVRSEFDDTGTADGCSLVGEEFDSDQTVADSQMRKAALDFMGDNVDRVPVVVAARIGRTFNVFRPFQQIHFEAERETPLSVLRLALVAYWALVPLAVFGVVTSRRRGIPVYPILVYFLVVVWAVALTIGAVRYRAPAEVPLVLLAAVGIDELIVRGLERRRQAQPDARTDPSPAVVAP